MNNTWLDSAHSCTWRGGWTLCVLAVVMLTAGTLVYLLDRPPDLIPFFAPYSLFDATPLVFGSMGQSLPSFTHVLAFSILTAALLQNPHKAALTVCSSWLLLDAFFEIGQIPIIATKLSAAVPSGPASTLLAPVVRYFRNGTFDPWDLLWIALGSVVAYVLILTTTQKRHSDA